MAQFDPDAYLAKKTATTFDPDAYLSQSAQASAAASSQYGSEVPQLDAQGQLIRQPDAIPDGRPMPPQWSKSDPTAYALASGARDLLGYSVEALGTAGGGMLGLAAGGPPGAVYGAGLGYGISQELLRGADVALGRAKPRTGLETVTEPVGNIAFGAVTEAAAPKVMSLLSKGAGRVVDFVKGNRPEIKAANMLRQSLESGTRSGVESAQNLLRQAPEGMTAAQATTDLKAPLWQSLNASVARQQGAVDDYANLLANQQANDIADLTQLAGGQSVTDIRKSVAGAKSALNLATEPTKRAALTAASDVSESMVGLKGEAATAREAAAIKADDARRMASAAEKAAARANQAFPVEGQPRVSGRYSYWGDEAAATAEKQLSDAASGSLKFGEAARLREAALESLQNAGLAPLEGKPLADQIRALTKDPAFAGNRERNIALGRVAKEIEQWTASNGVVDAHALDAIRKNVVNSIFANSPLSPKAKAKAVAQTMNDIRPAIIDAIENAGGAGYKEYLQTYQRGIQSVNQKQLMGVALDLYKNKTDDFIRLVDGDIPKSVEKVMGFGNFSIADEVGPEAMATLRSAAQTLKNAKEMTTQSSMAQDALRELLAENVSLMRLPSLISAKFAATNVAISILEKKIGKEVMKTLVDGLKTGRSAAELLDTLPASEKNRVLKLLSDPRSYGIPAGGLGVGAASATGADEYLRGLYSDPVGTITNQNNLSQQNRNSLRP
jgi:hypothetical protein